MTRTSAQYQMIRGKIRKSNKPVATRGLNPNYNRVLKEIFKSSATSACLREGVFKELLARWVSQGIRAEMARLTLTRKLAAITLTLWKKGELYDPEKLKLQSA